MFTLHLLSADGVTIHLGDNVALPLVQGISDQATAENEE